MPEGSFTLNDTDAALWAREQERETLRILQGSFSSTTEYLRALGESDYLFIAWRRRYRGMIGYWLNLYSDLSKRVERRLRYVADTHHAYSIDNGILFFGQIQQTIIDGASERNIQTPVRARERARGKKFPAYSLADAPEHLHDNFFLALKRQNDYALRIIGDTKQNLEYIQTGQPIKNSPTRPPPGILPPASPANRERPWYRRVLYNTGTNLRDRKVEIAIGMAAGIGVRVAFVTAATILTLPAAPVVFAGGIAAGMASGYAKAFYRSRKAGLRLTRKQALLEAFKGAAFAFGGEIAGYALASIIPSDWFHPFSPPKETVIGPSHPSTITSSPTPTTPVPVAPAVTAAPVTPVTAEALPPGPGDLRTDILNKLNSGAFRHLPHRIAKRLREALGTPGHEDWKHVMTPLADAGYYDYNGLGGAPHNLATRKLGVTFYGLAKRVVDTHNLSDKMATSVRKSATWLAQLPKFASSLS